MRRTSRLPIRTSNLLDPGSSTSRESRLSKTDGRKARASSTTRTSKCVATPSLLRSKSSSSLRRTPQSASTALRMWSAERQRIRKKDERPLQDKKWQADILRKTQEYFRNDPQGCFILNQRKSLRPITNTMFVQLVDVVLNNIDEQFERLTTTNYVEVLPKHLTLLMYPGVVTSSMMKTANTLHSWPYILAILSWLTDLHTKMQEVDNYLEENLFVLPSNVSNEQLREIQIKQLESKTLISSFDKWNKGEDNSEGFYDYVRTLKELYNFDDNTVRNLKQTAEKLALQKDEDEKEIQKQNKEIEQRGKNIAALTQEKQEKRQYLARLRDHALKLEKKNSDLEEGNTKLREAAEILEAKNTKLEETIKNQPMSVEESDNNLRIIEDLKAQKEILLKKKAMQQQISDETDLTISKLKRNNDTKLADYNLLFLKLELEHPELKDLVLQNTNMYDPNFKADVQETMRKFANFRVDLDRRVDLSRREKEAALQELLQLQQQREEDLKQNEILATQVKKLNEEMQSCSSVTEQECLDKYKVLESVRKETDDVQKSIPDKEKVMQRIRDNAARYDELEAQHKRDVKSELEKFVKFKEEIKNNFIPQFRELRNEVTDAIVKQHENLRSLPNPNEEPEQ